MARRADMDLLFGLLALQNGLIDQGTLFAAFAAWARDKERSMADLLVSQGSLDTQERGLLEGLVQKHLGRSGGDCGKSLSSISPIASVRAGLSQIGDAELAASLPPLSTAPDGGGDPFNTITLPSVGEYTSDGRRFRVLRPHAMGGLGQLYVARDTELGREVALKEIRDKYADDPSYRTRFEFEAAITGGLEHPGVVPVYGFGTHADGRPYYAMRFIRGITLKQAISEFNEGDLSKRDRGEWNLQLRRLLRRFQDVCNAIEYAHQRGVVHRDLKPNNIMLGKHGETLVVDWGLAKVVGRAESRTAEGMDERTLAPEISSGSSETLPGSAIGTPSYMSPEQAGGEIDRIGPASDVYSLGATLYMLLTGKPPFDGEDRGRLLQMVQSGQFRPPRSVDATIDPGLEAICLKAMALVPSSRYGSPRVLGEEIERWMADEPLLARKDPFSTRAARWVRRHRTFAAGLGIFLIVAASTSSVAAWLVEGQRSIAERQRRLAEDQRSIAEQQQRLAESNLAYARRLVDEIYTRVAGELENVPRMDAYQRTLLEHARDFYDVVALPQTRDESMIAAAAGTQLQLASIERKLERLEEARANAGRALERYQTLAGGDPSAIEPRMGLVEAISSLGQIDSQDRAFGLAVDRFRQAIELLKPLLKDHPGDARYRLVMGKNWRQLGQALVESPRQESPSQAYKNAREMLEPLALEDTGTETYRSEFATTLDAMASLCIKRNQDLEGEILKRRSLELRRAILKTRPWDLSARCGVAWGSTSLGYTYSRLGKVSEAQALLDEAVMLCEQIATEHPDVPRYRLELYMALSHRGALLRSVLRSTEAVAVYQRAAEVLASFDGDLSGSPDTQSRFAEQLYELARTEEKLSSLSDADKHMSKCIQICDRILGKPAKDLSVRVLRGQALLVRGVIARDRREFGAAISDFHAAAESHEAVWRENGEDPGIRGHLVEVLVEGLGKTFREAKRTREALASYGRAAELLAGMDRKDAIDEYNLACCLAQVSALAHESGEAALMRTAAENATRAIEALRRSLEMGGWDLDIARADSDLDPLRDREDFQRLLADSVFLDPFAQ